MEIISFIINFRRNYAICYGQVQVQKMELRYQKNEPYLTEAQ